MPRTKWNGHVLRNVKFGIGRYRDVNVMNIPTDYLEAHLHAWQQASSHSYKVNFEHTAKLAEMVLKRRRRNV